MRNFGSIKKDANNWLFEGVTSKDDFLIKKYKSFVKHVKSSPLLKEMYSVYNNFETAKFEDRLIAERFINDNLSIFSKYKKEEIANEVYDKLERGFSFQLTEQEDIIYDLIMESTADKSVKNLKKKMANLETLIQKLTESVKVEEEVVAKSNLEPKVLKKIVENAVEIYNNKFSFLSEDEHRIIKAFLHCDEKGKKEIFDTLISENINIVKRKLVESDDEAISEKLQLTESKLNEWKDKEKLEIHDYVKLIELKETLKS